LHSSLLAKTPSNQTEKNIIFKEVAKENNKFLSDNNILVPQTLFAVPKRSSLKISENTIVPRLDLASILMK